MGAVTKRGVIAPAHKAPGTNVIAAEYEHCFSVSERDIVHTVERSQDEDQAPRQLKVEMLIAYLIPPAEMMERDCSLGESQSCFEINNCRQSEDKYGPE